MRSGLKLFILGTILCHSLFTLKASGQDDVLRAEKYLMPPPEVARVVLAPRHRNVTLGDLDPTGTYFLISPSEGMTSLSRLAKKHHNLGGVDIDPLAHRARSLSLRGSSALILFDWRNKNLLPIETPEGALLGQAQWSPDGRWLAYLAHFETGSYVYIADVSTRKSRRLSDKRINGILSQPLEWTHDSRYLITLLVPEERRPAPEAPPVPVTPKVRISTEGRNVLRTFPSLLQTPEDAQLLKHYATAQLARIEVPSGRIHLIGKPSLIQRIDPSPDGEFIRVTTIQEPFSYLVPVSQFGTKEEIWDVQGEVKASLAERPLRLSEEATPADTGRQGAERRNLTWRPDGKGLSFLQRAPRESPQREDSPEQGRGAGRMGPPQQGAGASREQRGDRVMQWLPPFGENDVKVVYESPNPISNVRYSEDCQILFITESIGGREKLYAVFLDDPSRQYVLYEWNTEDAFSNPGQLATRPSSRGPSAVRLSSDRRFVYLVGTQWYPNPEEAAPAGFLDQVEIKTGKKERVFVATTDWSERVLQFLDDDAERLVISRENPTQVPNAWLWQKGKGFIAPLTENQDYTPEMTRLKRERFLVTRVDGFKFWVRITYPPNYVPGARFPAFFWIYPREYANQEEYNRAQRGFDKNRFPVVGPRSMEILALMGYVYVEPDCPIVGPSGRMNDYYIPELRNSLTAVVDELDRRGIIDRNRLGIGGHSYGAFSTANAMIHTPYFKAGIAGDGNFNRTLTPATFQNERRILWEARETYLLMSPLLWAEWLNGALLLYHGEDDQNVGTDPINSVRMFHALNALGKKVVLYMYPFEDHSPQARETILDLWARWIAWLDEHLKGSPKPKEKDSKANAPLSER